MTRAASDFKGVKRLPKVSVRDTKGMGKGLYWEIKEKEKEFAGEGVWRVRADTSSSWRIIIGIMDDPWRVKKEEWFRCSTPQQDGDGGTVGLKVFSTVTGKPVDKSIHCCLTRSEKVLSDDVGIQVKNYVYYDRTLIKGMKVHVHVVPPTSSSSTCGSESLPLSLSYVDVPQKCSWYRLNHLNVPNVSPVLKQLQCGRMGVVFYWNKDTPPKADEQLGFDYGDVPRQWRVSGVAPSPTLALTLPSRTRSGH